METSFLAEELLVIVIIVIVGKYSIAFVCLQ